MNRDHYTGRCVYCGWLKKDHGPKLKCKTRLMDTTFREWTDQDRRDVGERPLGGDPVEGPLVILPASHSVNAALRSGVKRVYGLRPPGSPGNKKRQIFGYRKPRKSTYAQGKLANGSWIEIVEVEIEPA